MAAIDSLAGSRPVSEADLDGLLVLGAEAVEVVHVEQHPHLVVLRGASKLRASGAQIERVRGVPPEILGCN